jgi:hypothetical protein
MSQTSNNSLIGDSMKVKICPECFEEMRKWLILQAQHDSYPTFTKMRQTSAYRLYERLDKKQDIEVK